MNGSSVSAAAMTSASTTSTTARRWSVVVLVASWSLAGLAIALVPFTEPTWHVGQWYGLVDTADAIVFGAVAWALLARGRHPVSWLVALCAVGGGLAALGLQWSMLVMAHPGVPDLVFLQTAQSWAWVPGTYAMIIIVPVLVRREPMAPSERVFLVVGAAAITGLTLMRLTDPYPWPDGSSWSPLGIRSTWWIDVLDRTGETQFRVVCVLAAIATADLVRRWARQTTAQRRGLGWLAIASGLMTATFLPLALPASWVADLPSWLTPVLHLTSQLFFPAALLVAVLGQRISGLEFIVGRATLWGVLTGVLVAVYVGIMAIGGALLPDDDGFVVAIATAAVAVLLTPVRGFAQRHIDALVRGDGAAPTRAFAGVGRRLGSAAGDSELLVAMSESVMHALRLGGLAIEVDWPSGARQLAAVGDMNRDSIETRALVVGGAVVGRLVVSGRRGELLDRSTSESLDDLAPVVGIVVQLVARTRELSESRTRIADARDEERRTLRRELHDGFGPALAGVALGLRAAHNVLPTQPADGALLVDRMAAEIDELVEVVRTLARGLVPPVLDELGLVPAIVDLAERNRVSGHLDVVVTADDVAADTAVSQAVYGIVAEAVRNVVRHADASSCAITLRRSDDEILVTVQDDGIGLPQPPVSGVGLLSMRERAEGIGAMLRVVNTGSGTLVEVSVPSAVGAVVVPA
jgi:signal transduction histidine kinase